MPVIDSNSLSQAVYVEQMRQFRAGGKQPTYRAAANRDERLKAAEINRYVNRVSLGARGWTGGNYALSTRLARQDTPPAAAAITCDRCKSRIRGKSARPYRSVYSYEGRVDYYRCRACGGR